MGACKSPTRCGVSEATASTWFAGRASRKSLRSELDGGVLLSNGGPPGSPCWMFSLNDAYMFEEFTPSKASITQLRQAAAVRPHDNGNTQHAPAKFAAEPGCISSPVLAAGVMDRP